MYVYKLVYVTLCLVLVYQQCYVPSIGISQVSAISYLKSIGIGSAGENGIGASLIYT